MTIESAVSLAFKDGWTVRHPAMTDLDEVLALVTASDIEEFGEPDYTLDDLRDEWQEIDLAHDAWLIFSPEGSLAGYAQESVQGAHVRIDSEGYVHPDYAGKGVGTALIRLIEGRARQHAALAADGEHVVLNNFTNGANQDARSLLERLGFSPVRHFWRMRIDLDPSLPPTPPHCPATIKLQACRDETDQRRAFASIDEAFHDHWGYVPQTFEDWYRRVASVCRDPSLWFLALDGDEVAGAIVGGYQIGQGWIKDLAVRRAWRRQGLGGALLDHAFGAFWHRGTYTIGLGVDAESPTGATRLYERAGMRVVREFATYQKELRPGTGKLPAKE